VKLTRRAVLRFAAGAVLAPTFARDARLARADGARPLRLVLLMQANGTSQSTFWPDASGRSPMLDPILTRPRLKSLTTIVKGLYNHAGGAGNQHDQGFAGLWTGMRTVGTFGDPWGAGMSIDQMLRPDLVGSVPFPTLNCGVLALDAPLFKDHRTSFSYLGPREQMPTEIDPVRLHARLFAPAQDPEVAKQRLVEKKSVLDFGASDLARMRSRLGKDERDKLDVHATAIREYEERLAILAARPAPVGACAAPGAPPSGLDPHAEKNVPVLLPAMIDLVALALACDLTRIVTFPIGNAGVSWRYDWLGIHKNSHDDIAHRDDGRNPVVTEAIQKIGAWHADHVVRLALALDAIPEGSGTVLDNTLIVWGNELATGQHGLDGIPIVMLGGAAGRLRPAGVVDHGPQTHHRLGTTVLNVMGAPAKGFGEEPACGSLRGLTLAS
jgi:hypothetical protein